MSEELRPCPFCSNIAGKRFEPTIGDYYGCPNHTNMMMTVEQWQSRPIEDALRTKLDIAVEALKEVVLGKAGINLSANFIRRYDIEIAEEALAKIRKDDWNE